MRNRYVLALASFAVLLVVALPLLVQNSSSSASNLSGVQPTYPGYTPIPTGPTVPQPSFDNVTPLPAQGGTAISPPVTEEKVREYVAKGHMGEVIAEQIDTTEVQFLTAAQIAEAVDEPSLLNNFPADKQMVLVTQRGDFSMWNFDGDAQLHYPFAFWIFDAVTGNQMVFGTRLEPPN